VQGVPKPLLSQADWYASLPAVYMSAGMLITDLDGRVLIVKPNYRPYWSIPGGIVEAAEAPHDGATREIAEELGLDIPAGDLLVVDWAPPENERPRGITSYIFDGGTLADPAAIRLQEEELDDAQFVSWAEAAARMLPSTATRIPAARHARYARRPVYLPGWQPPG
jgi:8-oxo-dGTP diphosphatase